MKRSQRIRTGIAAVAATALALSACSPASESGSDTGESADATEISFRLWDAQAARAYEESFAEFTQENPDITVSVEVVEWNDYWEKLPLDVASGDMADVYWMNSANFGAYADNGNLLDVEKHVGDGGGEWQESVTGLYTRNGTLWGVPQLWDSIALYYNKELVEEAGIDPAELVWDPSGQNDTLIAAAQQLTTDESGKHPGAEGYDPDTAVTYGFNAASDRQAILGPFIASNGADWHADDKLAFASDEGAEAIQYVADLINEEHVAPPAADTNQNGDLTRDLFNQGKLALFQSGPYNLKNIEEAAAFEWGIAPMVEGPEGRIPVVHGVAAVGNAESEHEEATVKLLKWLGTAAGQQPLAENGVSFPGVNSVQDSFVNYWKEKNVDVQPFIDAANGETAPADVGPKANAGLTEALPVFEEIMIGRLSAAEGLEWAQEKGNAAME